MDANFNDFLQGEIYAPDIDERLDITDAVQEEESRKYATGVTDVAGVAIESSFNSKCQATHRIPTLFQFALFSVTKVINTLIASNDQADQLPTLFANINDLPEHAKKAILPQLTFTALKKYYGNDIWDMLAHPTKETLPIMLSSMKQEEDMMRYLYEYAPENEYVIENQDKILLDVFEDVPAKCLVTSKFEDAPDTIICGFDYSKDKHKVNTNVDDEMDFVYDPELGPVVDQETFKKNWKEFTHGLLDEFDWSNCFAAGGSVLACLRKLPTDYEGGSDIDLYLVGLNKEEAKQKLQHIWDTLQRKIGDRKLHVLKTKNTFTFFADLPFRPIQIITGLRSHPEDPRVEELPSNVHKLVELMSLAKVVLLSRTLYRFNFDRLVSKITAWNLRWQKGISINRMRWSLLESDALKRAGETSVTKEFAKLRDLALLTVDQLRQFWAEAPRYESVTIELDWKKAEYYADQFKGEKRPVASSADEFKPILDQTEFATYASSMLQCFYLDIIIPCENSGKASINNDAIKSSSPLSYINTSLAQLDYEFYSVDVKFTGLKALWENKSFEIISEPVRAGKHSWRVKLDSKKDQHVVWISLIHEENDLSGLHNNESIMKHCFANFVLTMLSTSNEKRDHLNLDGSYIFTSGSKHNTWTTFLLKNYLISANQMKNHKVHGLVPEDDLPHMQQYIYDSCVLIDDNGEMNMTLHLQYLTPNVNVVAL